MPKRPERKDTNDQQRDSSRNSKHHGEVSNGKTSDSGVKRVGMGQGKQVVHTKHTPSSARATGTSSQPQTPKESLREKLLKGRGVEGDGSSHLIIQACAGTGKTTTIVEGIRRIRGEETKVEPTEEQEAIWKEMAQTKGKFATVAAIAFNNHVAAELEQRAPSGVSVMTSHVLGKRTITRAWGEPKLNKDRLGDMIAKALNTDKRSFKRREPDFYNGLEQMVRLCKQQLAGFLNELEEEDMDRISSHFDVDMGDSREVIYELIPKVLKLCKSREGGIDFDDMMWLPIVMELPFFQYDMLLVDEAQDLSILQQQVSLKAGRRIILVGDPKQAIYGFAGADCDSLPRLSQILETTDRGIKTLPLTVTRRCARSIVREAQQLVPEIRARPDAPEGTVGNVFYPMQWCEGDKNPTELPWDATYAALCVPGDFVVCRVNAPLVSQTFRFIKRGIKASMVGREVGAGLLRLLAAWKAGSIVELRQKLETWYAKEKDNEYKRKTASQQRLIALRDRYECLRCFISEAETVDGVKKRILEIFSEDKEGIRLSSVHLSKGLEANSVFLLLPKGASIPHPMASQGWQTEQEWNLKYIAITRAKENLIYVV